MNEALVLASVFLITFGIGIFLIVNSPRLHTPLMSVTCDIRNYGRGRPVTLLG